MTTAECQNQLIYAACLILLALFCGMWAYVEDDDLKHGVLTAVAFMFIIAALWILGGNFPQVMRLGK